VALRIMTLASSSGASEPLIVVDRVPRERAGRTIGLNPRDIELIEVLKDGGSTALFGRRGAYGVVVISTKNGAR
jgi:TonB-dependent starch-binding outer membrane protein SusC